MPIKKISPIDKKQAIKYTAAVIAGAIFGPHIGPIVGEVVGALLPLFGF